MLLKIAWKNIWRNRTRSLVVITSVIIGLWAALFMTAFSWGLYQGHIDDSIENYLSHLQIHHPSYPAEKMPEFSIPEGSSVFEAVKKDQRVMAATARVLSSGMVTSPTSVSGVSICGINPADEFKVSTVEKQMVEGHVLDLSKKHQILIGRKLAQKLKVKVKGKIVLTFQTLSGEITAGSFRVAGIFKTQNAIFDETNVFVAAKELSAMLGTGEAVHEIAVLLQNEEDCDAVSAMIRSKFPQVLSQTWKELSPELRLVIESFNEYMLIFIGIILLALMFGIVNTMLMAVLERQREIGMLMAIGMNKTRIFLMIVSETFMLVCLGSPFGILITHLSVSYFGKKGIDISAFSEGLAAWGFRSRVYTHLDQSNYLPVILLTASCALVSSLYPAYRALKFRPAEAIRKI
jgi:ABC-type lipoprotein release transport system permease subunit